MIKCVANGIIAESEVVKEDLITIKNNLVFMGFDFSLLGSNYLRDLVYVVIKNPCLLHSITSTAMQCVAQQWLKTNKSIDRDIRWAIKNAFKKGILKTVPCFNCEKIPSTKQILHWLFDYFT